MVYKGLMLAEQVGAFFPDLTDERTVSKLCDGALALLDQHVSRVGARASVSPHRPNGEINTLRGNSAWMSAREALLEERFFHDAIEDFKPIIRRAAPTRGPSTTWSTSSWRAAARCRT